MLEGLIVTILSSIIVIWVGFSMVGRDEARVSASVDLNKWYTKKRQASVVDIEDVELTRNFVSLLGRGVQKQSGNRVTLEYKNVSGNIVKTKHLFYDNSDQDEAFLGKYIKDNKIYVWLSDTGRVYVPGEIIENKKVQTIYGADKVMIYTLLTSGLVGLVSTLFLLFMSPFWVLVHVPIILLSSIVPQVFMYIQEVSSEVQRKDYVSVSALNQFGLYIDTQEDGISRYKLVEQTLPMVLLEEGVGYLGYTPNQVEVLINYDGDIPVHISSEYHIPEIVTTTLHKLRRKKK